MSGINFNTKLYDLNYGKLPTTERLCNLCHKKFMAKKFDRFCQRPECRDKYHAISTTDLTYVIGEAAVTLGHRYNE